MSARIDYVAGGEDAYTGGSSRNALADYLLNNLRRLADVEVERVISSRTPIRSTPTAPAPAPRLVDALPEWVPMAALAGGALLLFLLLRKG
jgi:hypothetical protein